MPFSMSVKATSCWLSNLDRSIELSPHCLSEQPHTSPGQPWLAPPFNSALLLLRVSNQSSSRSCDLINSDCYSLSPILQNLNYGCQSGQQPCTSAVLTPQHETKAEQNRSQRGILAHHLNFGSLGPSWSQFILLQQTHSPSCSAAKLGMQWF